MEANRRPEIDYIMLVMALFSYSAGSKAFPPVRPRYDDKYRSRSHYFVEQQKLCFLLLLVLIALADMLTKQIVHVQ